jgi:formylglycine-generating enzyme required for sulfatase activity
VKKILLASLLLSACAAPQTAAPALPATAVYVPVIMSSATVATAVVMPLTLEGFATATFPAPPATPTTVTYMWRVSPKDGMTQVYVPAGTLHMGGLDVYAENDELPYHDVSLKEFWLDQTEVTNGMYALCAQAGTCRPPQKPSSIKRPSYFGNPEFQDYPVVQITWGDAQAYCTWAGRRLLTEAEWERAARGDDMRTYPWGDEPPTERYANFNNLIRDTSRVGSYPAGASPFGALDMAGNVWEWVSDFYLMNYYESAPTADPPGPVDSFGRYQRVIRGGSFQDEFISVRLSNRGYELGPNPAAAAGSVEIEGKSSVKIGFRCAADQ